MKEKTVILLDEYSMLRVKNEIRHFQKIKKKMVHQL